MTETTLFLPGLPPVDGKTTTATSEPCRRMAARLILRACYGIFLKGFPIECPSEACVQPSTDKGEPRFPKANGAGCETVGAKRQYAPK
jgi:hypothetical protein